MTLKEKTISLVTEDRLSQLCEDEKIAIPYPKEENFRLISRNANTIFGACQNQEEALKILDKAAKILANFSTKRTCTL